MATLTARAVPTHGIDRVYLTPEDLVARYKGNPSLRTLRRWRKTGDGPAHTKVGRSVRYALGDVRAWEATQRQPCGAPPASGQSAAVR